MGRRRGKKGAPQSGDTPLVSVGTTVSSLDGFTLEQINQPLTAMEEAFCREFVGCNNATIAYLKATGFVGPRHAARTHAWELTHRAHVRRRIREYESAAAAAAVIDYAAILDHDRQIVEGYRHADQITQYIHQACRYCCGNGHKYQWVDMEEYLTALTTAQEENEAREAMGKRPLNLPTDEGGYGYTANNDPDLFCPKCEGRGIPVAVIADTTKLAGPARVLVKGIKITSHGTEVLMHDVDKAKERLLRSGGILGDDAASVARGAAAGAAAGATAAIAAAKAAEEMTAEEAQRLYLEMA